ncbi:MAG: hypothetical protein ABSF54_25430 [Bryobacteraceae bacterium]|jgi:hypothetical protein
MIGFKENPGSVEIDLLPGGGKVDPGPLTVPTNRLPRDYGVNAKVRDAYLEAWDKIHSAI